MTILFILSSISLSFLFLLIPKKQIPQEDKYPILYPDEAAIDNFDSIVQEINNSDCWTDINAIYVRIIIFKSCYPSEVFLYEVLESSFKNKTVVS